MQKIFKIMVVGLALISASFTGYTSFGGASMNTLQNGIGEPIKPELKVGGKIGTGNRKEDKDPEVVFTHDNDNLKASITLPLYNRVDNEQTTGSIVSVKINDKTLPVSSGNIVNINRDLLEYGRNNVLKINYSYIKNSYSSVAVDFDNFEEHKLNELGDYFKRVSYTNFTATYEEIAYYRKTTGMVNGVPVISSNYDSVKSNFVYSKCTSNGVFDIKHSYSYEKKIDISLNSDFGANRKTIFDSSVIARYPSWYECVINGINYSFVLKEDARKEKEKDLQLVATNNSFTASRYEGSFSEVTYNGIIRNGITLYEDKDNGVIQNVVAGEFYSGKLLSIEGTIFAFVDSSVLDYAINKTLDEDESLIAIKNLVDKSKPASPYYSDERSTLENGFAVVKTSFTLKSNWKSSLNLYYKHRIDVTLPSKEEIKDVCALGDVKFSASGIYNVKEYYGGVQVDDYIVIIDGGTPTYIIENDSENVLKTLLDNSKGGEIFYTLKNDSPYISFISKDITFSKVVFSSFTTKEEHTTYFTNSAHDYGSITLSEKICINQVGKYSITCVNRLGDKYEKVINVASKPLSGEISATNDSLNIKLDLPEGLNKLKSLEISHYGEELTASDTNLVYLDENEVETSKLVALNKDDKSNDISIYNHSYEFLNNKTGYGVYFINAWDSYGNNYKEYINWNYVIPEAKGLEVIFFKEKILVDESFELEVVITPSDAPQDVVVTTLSGVVEIEGMNVKGLSKGKAEIIITSVSNASITTSINIEVKEKEAEPPVVTLDVFNRSLNYLNVGEELALDYKVSNEATVVIETNNNEVVLIENNDLVALKEGEAKVIFKVVDSEIKKEITIKVLPIIRAIFSDSEGRALTMGEEAVTISGYLVVNIPEIDNLVCTLDNESFSGGEIKSPGNHNLVLERQIVDGEISKVDRVEYNFTIVHVEIPSTPVGDDLTGLFIGIGAGAGILIGVVVVVLVLVRRKQSVK